MGISNNGFGIPPGNLTLTDSVITANRLSGSAGYLVNGGRFTPESGIAQTRTVIAGNSRTTASAAEPKRWEQSPPAAALDPSRYDGAERRADQPQFVSRTAGLAAALALPASGSLWAPDSALAADPRLRALDKAVRGPILSARVAEVT